MMLQNNKINFEIEQIGRRPNMDYQTNIFSCSDRPFGWVAP